MWLEEMLFQPEQIDAMYAAFVIVCTRLRLRAGAPESDRVAATIVDVAKAGDYEPERLASRALYEINK
jgi:hypothetical protein